MQASFIMNTPMSRSCQLADTICPGLCCQMQVTDSLLVTDSALSIDPSILS